MNLPLSALDRKYLGAPQISTPVAGNNMTGAKALPEFR